MNTNRNSQHRKLLLTLRAEFLSGFRGKLETLVGPDHAAEEDWAPVSHDQFIALQLTQISFQQLKLVDAALERLRSDEYGICLDCGNPISPRRLEAVPWAIRCVTCEELHGDTAQDSAEAEVEALAA